VEESTVGTRIVKIRDKRQFLLIATEVGPAPKATRTGRRRLESEPMVSNSEELSSIHPVEEIIRVQRTTPDLP